MVGRKSLNDIGPGVRILRRHGKWSVRFRIPAEIAEQYDVPRNPRFTTDRLNNATGPHEGGQALRREANRIGAKLDLLFTGQDAAAPGQSLASWLGLVETSWRRTETHRNRPQDRSWPDLVNLYIDAYRSETIAREANERTAVRQLEALRDRGLYHERAPAEITPDEWDDYFDSLLRERPDPARGQTT